MARVPVSTAGVDERTAGAQRPAAPVIGAVPGQGVDVGAVRADHERRWPGHALGADLARTGLPGPDPEPRDPEGAAVHAATDGTDADSESNSDSGTDTRRSTGSRPVRSRRSARSIASSPASASKAATRIGARKPSPRAI